MKYFLGTGLWLFFPFLMLGQSRPVVLRGTLGVEGGELFTFKLVITEGDSGRLTGVAYTWLNEAADAKTAVTGTIDRQRKKLSFREINIIHNNNFQSRAILCLLDAHLNYKFGNNGFTLEGPVTSADLAAASCAKGTLVFATEDVLKQLFAAPAPRDTGGTAVAAVPNLKLKVTAQSPIVPKIIKDLQKITRGVEKIFEWTTDTVLVEVWDGGRGDGDIISIGYNGMPVLSHYPLTGDKLLLRLQLSGKAMDEITVIAEGEGYAPQTTAHFLLTDGYVQYPVIASNKAGKEAVMRIRKKSK